MAWSYEYSSYFRTDAILGASSMEVRQEFQIPEHETLNAGESGGQRRIIAYSIWATEKDLQLFLCTKINS